MFSKHHLATLSDLHIGRYYLPKCYKSPFFAGTTEIRSMHLIPFFAQSLLILSAGYCFRAVVATVCQCCRKPSRR